MTLIEEKNRSALDKTIKGVKQGFKEFKEWKLIKLKELIRTLGKAFEKVVPNPKEVCEARIAYKKK